MSDNSETIDYAFSRRDVGSDRDHRPTKPCCERIAATGMHCGLPEKHDGDHQGPPPRYGPTPPSAGWRLLKTSVPRAISAASPVTSPVFPAIGSRHIDGTRVLIVHEVRASDHGGRNVIGKVYKRELLMPELLPYACDLQTFEAIWKPA